MGNMVVSWYQWQGEDLILNVRVQPQSSKDELVGTYGDRLKIRITAPPVDGKANRHLVGFLATTFGVRKSAVNILRGLSGKDKQLRIKTPKTLPEGIRRAARHVG